MNSFVFKIIFRLEKSKKIAEILKIEKLIIIFKNN